MNENNNLNRVRAALYDSYDYQHGSFYVCGDNNHWYEIETWEYVEVAYDLR